MATSTRVALLLLGLIVVCSADGPFSKAVRLGRGLTEEKRNNKECSFDKCKEPFWASAFISNTACEAAHPILKACLEAAPNSADFCKCNFRQVDHGRYREDTCIHIHTSDECTQSEAKACIDETKKMKEAMLWDKTMSAEDKQALFKKVEECTKKVIDNGLAAGCGREFDNSDVDAVDMLNAKGWSVGCDLASAAWECPNGFAHFLEECSKDIVTEYMECARKMLVAPSCPSILSEKESILKGIYERNCARMTQTQNLMKEKCSAGGQKRSLFKKLLKLLDNQE